MSHSKLPHNPVGTKRSLVLRSDLIADREQNKSEKTSIASKRAKTQSKASVKRKTVLDDASQTKTTDKTTKPDNQPDAVLSNVEMLEPTKESFFVDQNTKAPIHVIDINVRTSSDTENCYIPGSCLLKNNRLMITDYNNRKIKLLDTERLILSSELQIPGEPFDIAAVTDDEVAVTTDTGKTVQFVTITADAMSLGKEVVVNGQCRGIAFNEKDQLFIVSYHSPAKVEIMKLNGTVLKTCVTVDKKGVPLFKTPNSIALDKARGEIHVSDYTMETVTILKPNGRLRYVFKSNRTWRSPRKIFYNEEECNVSVVCSLTHTVFQQNPGTNHFYPILNRNHGLCSPHSITFDENKARLYIGQRSEMKVYQM